MFVKLHCDRQLREDPKIKALLDLGGKVRLPKDAVTFSLHWIEAQKLSPNPVNDILFENLSRNIERDIAARRKKRHFWA